MKKFLLSLCLCAMGLTGYAQSFGGTDFSSSDLTINGTEVSMMLMAVCEEGHLAGEYWVSFDTMFYYQYDMVTFGVSVPFKSFSQLKEGQELIDYLDISSFYVMMGDNTDIGFGGGNPRYKNFKGSVKVQQLTNATVNLNFSNFSFTKSRGDNEQDYTFNGTVTYNFNPAGTGAIIDIVTDEESSTFNVYDMTGRHILFTTDKEDLNNLPKGLYIINGKKHFIK